MDLPDSINRTVNLVGITIVGLSGFAFAPEILLEQDWPDKIDDTMLLALGIAGIVWYLQGRNRFNRSLVPLVLVVLALLAKVLALIIEFSDAASVGDDFGGLILLALSVALVWYLYKQAKDALTPINVTPLRH